MYQTGKVLVHSRHGLCRVTDVREEKFTGTRKQYYILHPLAEPEQSVLYIPVESIQRQTREVLTVKQINDLIHRAEEEKMEWIPHNNTRKAAYQEVLKTGSVPQLLALIRCLEEQKKKKLPQADEKVLAEASCRICQEFAYSLRITEEQVPEYIRGQIHFDNSAVK